MAVTKLWPVKTRMDYVLEYVKNPEKTDQKYADMKNVLEYAQDDTKTDHALFVEGINCNAAGAYEQFVAVKQQYGKTDGIMAYHGYLSFEEMDIRPEQAMEIGMEFAKEIWGDRFQVVVCTHMNTEHLHCHFVVNSVSFVDGKRAHGKETSWFQFSTVADRICKERGLSTVKKKERNLSPKTLEQKDKSGALTPWNIARAAIDDAIARSRTFPELEANLKKMGYTFDFNPNHKYWTIIPKGSKKSVRLYRLGEDYTPDAIKRRLAENLRRNYGRVPARPASLPPVRRRSASRVETILGRKQKRGGLQGLYLHYLYLLGKLPARRTPNPARVHYALRQDLLKLEAVSAQARLLCEHNISTDTELLAYRADCQRRINALTAERTALRNLARRVNTPEPEIEKAREQITAISGELAGLRKEIKHCDAIAQRSGLMAERLEQARTQEQTQQRKEQRTYEYQRR